MPRVERANMVLDNVLCLNLQQEIEEPVLRLLVDCIRELNPTIQRASRQHGAGMISASLIVIAVNMAIDEGNPTLVAEALRQNAEMLDGEAKVASIEGTA